jgi:folylpolyglutamate synthase/dihydropteroate synthase
MDGAHNPPAAEALSAALREKFPGLKLPLVAGFCADKDAQAVLTTLAPLISKGFAVKTNNQRSLSAQDVSNVMEISGIPSEPCASLAEAMEKSREGVSDSVPTLVTGSLFLVGEALNLLRATSLGGTSSVIDPSELLRGT